MALLSRSPFDEVGSSCHAVGVRNYTLGSHDMFFCPVHKEEKSHLAWGWRI